MIDTGDRAPDFILEDPEGKEVSLSNFKGKWIVLYFYPRDNTSGCTKEARDFTELRPAFNQLNAVVIGISPDKPATHEKFIAKHDLDIILLSDPDKKILKAYGAWGKKKNYGREYEGVIRSTFIISPDQRIAALWRNVRVRTKRKGEQIRHADLVKAKLEELQREI